MFFLLMWGICLFNIQKRKRPDFHKPGRRYLIYMRLLNNILDL